MSLWRFKSVDSLEDILLESLGTELLLPATKPNVATYFHNGDTMTVDMLTGNVAFDTLNAEDLPSSKLGLRLNQWFAKGLIVEQKLS